MAVFSAEKRWKHILSERKTRFQRDVTVTLDTISYIIISVCFTVFTTNCTDTRDRALQQTLTRCYLCLVGMEAMFTIN